MKKTTHRNNQGQLVTISMAADATNLGISTVRHLAIEAGAAIKIGRSFRIDLEKLMKYVRSEYSVD